ncbi:MAG TPA: type II toxin-antitoxin system prevent-host-death family antitoxin [Phycisphaerae bacterium]|nr:type II toxin-antitoxin system prevent-host-death family antitoxin [Phycisphaerae bacterium]HRR85556.1 type II toxin-antitoxin system prevent-host-death family antitoxin [Phycisphaerae bacterium]
MTDHRRSIVGAHEANVHFYELLKRVEKGEEVTITRHGSPVARLVPVKQSVASEERTASIRRWQKSSKGITVGRLKVRDLVNEGRP